MQKIISDLFSECNLSKDQVASLCHYLERLSKWSARINLTGFRKPEKAAEGLLFDATEISPLIPSGSLVADVGAGAGGLSIALCVLRPDLRLWAIEPRSKRAVFIRTLRRELKLGDALEVLEDRVEDLPPDYQKKADVAFAQAVMAPEEWIRAGSEFVKPGGIVLCLTSRPVSEISPQPIQVEEQRQYSLPFSNTPRVVSKIKVP